jgi:hypothetical protein
MTEVVNETAVKETALKSLTASFIKTTYDISLDSQISLLPLGFSLLGSRFLHTRLVS